MQNAHVWALTEIKARHYSEYTQYYKDFKLRNLGWSSPKASYNAKKKLKEKYFEEYMEHVQKAVSLGFPMNTRPKVLRGRG
jgi:hypothetical protein